MNVIHCYILIGGSSASVLLTFLSWIHFPLKADSLRLTWAPKSTQSKLGTRKRMFLGDKSNEHDIDHILYKVMICLKKKYETGTMYQMGTKTIFSTCN